MHYNVGRRGQFFSFLRKYYGIARGVYIQIPVELTAAHYG